ncbi:hypothetical protein [Vibrio owensii]|uniref:hypothetical protein n=1 Tax=Vibrio owensii TaxID=696485 RepID=UPI003CC5F1E7
MKNTTRAIRRHHYSRLRNKRLKQKYWGQDMELKKRHLGICVNTPTICSCHMCGNPRKKFGWVTLQEVKANQANPKSTWY